ncbi:MAG TPA: killer suppression protein HigA [Ignavibacteria bacterium]|nr:killer suppression protein HigA [Bacteroidota bacterium]HRF66842.1 killer suppression protein HigA [Ignavibacteria bacterium]HRJ03789.1 killer suppression protein HigA [Ignavibacteria bacterium]
MKITFKDPKLQKIVNNSRNLQKEYGPIMAKKITQRLQDLLNCQTLEDSKNLPGRFHELVGDRKGQWACDLQHPKRLIFIPHEIPIPENENGQYIWSEIKGIEIIEITDYHQ